jgi:protein-L-isoaspartate O-methyltransferase
MNPGNIKTWIKNANMENLLKRLIQGGVIQTNQVYEAMSQVDRGDFTDSAYAYVDS